MQMELQVDARDLSRATRSDVCGARVQIPVQQWMAEQLFHRLLSPLFLREKKLETNYKLEQPVGGVPIKMWTRGVPVIDEIPMAYKDIDAVVEAQKDLVEVVYTLKQVACGKG